MSNIVVGILLDGVGQYTEPKREVRYDEMTGQPYQKTIQGRRVTKYGGMFFAEFGYDENELDVYTYGDRCLIGLTTSGFNSDIKIEQIPSDFYSQKDFFEDRDFVIQLLMSYYPQLEFNNEDIKLYHVTVPPMRSRNE